VVYSVAFSVVPFQKDSVQDAQGAAIFQLKDGQMEDAINLAKEGEKLALAAIEKHQKSAVTSQEFQLLNSLNQLWVTFRCIQILGEQDAN
jgi:hypothetical protein